MRRIFLLGTLAFLVVLAGCGGADGRKPSRAEAEALLSDFFHRAQARDGGSFCADKRVFSADSCQTHWQWAGGTESVPKDAPKVLGGRTEDDLLVLRVCGTDGLGRPYRGDFVVERQEDRVSVPLPVFWEGIGYSGTYEEGKKRVEAKPTPTERVGCP
jgi:hypothetical protein